MHAEVACFVLYELIKGSKTLCVIGMCKNAGKTTVLNSLISCCNAREETLGLTSIGRDGESKDVVTNTHKPSITVRTGTLIATADGLLSECDISREILAATGVFTPMGEVVVVRAMSDGCVQLAGASMTEQAAAVRDMLFGFGADRVMIDGAISRKSIAMPVLSDAAILCSGASYGADMDAAAEDTAYAASLFRLNVFEYAHSLENRFTVICNKDEYRKSTFSDVIPLLKSGRASAVVIKGGLTDGMAREIVSAGKQLTGLTIVAEDAGRLLLSKALYERITRLGAGFAVLRGTRLLAVTVNPFSAYGNHYESKAFRSAVQSALGRLKIDIPTFDIMDVKDA